MKVFFANCKYENWEACKKHNIFGLRSRRLLAFEPGDIILLRSTSHSGLPYGVKAVWLYTRAQEVTSDTFMPWKDSEYKWIIHCYPIVELSKPFNEEFVTTSKISTKIKGLYATRIMGSMGLLKPEEAIGYLKGILIECANELQNVITYHGKEFLTFNILTRAVDELKRTASLKANSSAENANIEYENGFQWRGKKWVINREELIKQVKELLSEGIPPEAARFQRWYIQIDNYTVSPKWLFHFMTGVDYSDFDSSTARKKLGEIGFTIMTPLQKRPDGFHPICTLLKKQGF